VEAIAAPIFDNVHGSVSVLEQLISFETIVGINTGADTDSNVDLAISNGDGPGSALNDQRAAAFDVFNVLEVRHDDHEFITAHAGNGVRLADGREKPFADSAQECIAISVPQGVVDAFEVVNIKHKDSDLPVMTPRAEDSLVQAIVKQSTIG
jgi:hypothetical protein